jgi:uncharacterized coiled-coil protein SlyX
MKATTIGAWALAATGLALATFEYNSVRALRQQLQHNEAQVGALRVQLQQRSAELETQSAANAQLQSTFEGQIANLQSSLESSSLQLSILSESLQQTRELLPANTAVKSTSDDAVPSTSP